MGPLRRLLSSWWRKSVRVERLHEDRDDHIIVIDAADGSAPQTLSVRRNDLCSLAWVCERVDQERLRDVNLTWRGHFYSEEEQEVTLSVPDWARRALYRKLREAALSVGWRGEVYRPASAGAYRR